MNKSSWVTCILMTGLVGFGIYELTLRQASAPKPINYHDGQFDGNIGMIDITIAEANKFQSAELTKAVAELSKLKTDLQTQHNSGKPVQEINQYFASNTYKLDMVTAQTHKSSIPSAIQCYKATKPSTTKLKAFEAYLTQVADLEIKIASTDNPPPDLKSQMSQTAESAPTEETKCGF
jgi:hypothetical protein